MSKAVVEQDGPGVHWCSRGCKNDAQGYDNGSKEDSWRHVGPQRHGGDSNVGLDMNRGIPSAMAARINLVFDWLRSWLSRACAGCHEREIPSSLHHQRMIRRISDDHCVQGGSVPVASEVFLKRREELPKTQIGYNRSPLMA